ncbi:MAG: rhamnulokinase family protein [Clostridia bacterium]
MKKINKVLAFDFGASSGRALLGELQDNKIVYTEICRFKNTVVQNNGLRWDVDYLFDNIKQALKLVATENIEAIGIDTWGVDYVLLGENGEKLENPYCYRDTRTIEAEKQVYNLISQQELYQITGTSPARFNTIYQLFAHKSEAVFAEAKKMLLIPDYFAYLLTGNMRAEYTIATTTGLLDIKTKNWSNYILEKLDIKRSLFCDIIKTGETYGKIKCDLATELGIKQVPVIAVCTHDTASAIVSTPYSADPSIYISCGTWSLIGVENCEPVFSNKHFTNEGGAFGSITYLQNVVGMWLMQECKRIWNESDNTITFKKMDEFMEGSTINAIIDTNAEEFMLPCDMPLQIANYCKTHHLQIPNSKGDIVKLIYDSLAVCYANIYKEICDTMKTNYRVIHIIGGGSKGDYLCQKTAELANITVTAGPVEATALGNLAIQFVSLGLLQNLSEARKIIANCEKIKYFKGEK